MADKTSIRWNTEAGDTGDTVDPVYSLAENVRKVAGVAAVAAHEQENEPKKKKAKIEKAAKQKNTSAEKTAKTKASAQKTAPRPIIVSKKKEESGLKEKADGKKHASAAPADAESGEDEFVEIRPDFFWKLSTIVLAILVLWSYFFR